MISINFVPQTVMATGDSTNIVGTFNQKATEYVNKYGANGQLNQTDFSNLLTQEFGVSADVDSTALFMGLGGADGLLATELTTGLILFDQKEVENEGDSPFDGSATSEEISTFAVGAKSLGQEAVLTSMGEFATAYGLTAPSTLATPTEAETAEATAPAEATSASPPQPEAVPPQQENAGWMSLLQDMGIMQTAAQALSGFIGENNLLSTLVEVGSSLLSDAPISQKIDTIATAISEEAPLPHAVRVGLAGFLSNDNVKEFLAGIFERSAEGISSGEAQTAPQE
jgi:hypothetical protein